MLKRKTCLLLGAGASAHLGFPLGVQLKDKMLWELNKHKDKQHDQIPDEIGMGGEDLRTFFDKLAFGHWTSPDAFLEKHPEFMTTGKYLICRCLADAESEWGVASNRGWYDRLISAIHVENASQLKDNQLSIITFNYDRSIDFRLHKYVENQFGIESTEAWQLLTDAVPLIHLHGTLGDYPKWEYGHQADFHDRANDIKIVSEIADNLPAFREASELLNNADRVVVLGFGFGADNVRRLNFFKEQEKESRDVIVAAGNGGQSVGTPAHSMAPTMGTS